MKRNEASKALYKIMGDKHMELETQRTTVQKLVAEGKKANPKEVNKAITNWKKLSPKVKDDVTAARAFVPKA